MGRDRPPAVPDRRLARRAAPGAGGPVSGRSAGAWGRVGATSRAGSRSTAAIAVVALSVVWGGAALLAPHGAPPEIVVLGVIRGSATALAAVGLVLVWR